MATVNVKGKLATESHSGRGCEHAMDVDNLLLAISYELSHKYQSYSYYM